MTRSKSLFNLNRLMILLFVVLGQMSDGFQSGDFFFFAATVLWIWLPSCVRLETTVINYITHGEPGPNDKEVKTGPRKTEDRVSIH